MENKSIMTTRTRLIILGVVCLCVVLASLWQQSQERHIGRDVYDQIHDGMREEDVIALLGTPWPAKYDADGNPIPVALVAGLSWDILRVIPSKAPGAHDSGIAKWLEFVGDEWGISVSFNVAGQLSWRALLRRPELVDAISKMRPTAEPIEARRREAASMSEMQESKLGQSEIMGKY